MKLVGRFAPAPSHRFLRGPRTRWRCGWRSIEGTFRTRRKSCPRRPPPPPFRKADCTVRRALRRRCQRIEAASTNSRSAGRRDRHHGRLRARSVQGSCCPRRRHRRILQVLAIDLALPKPPRKRATQIQRAPINGGLLRGDDAQLRRDFSQVLVRDDVRDEEAQPCSLRMNSATSCFIVLTIAANRPRERHWFRLPGALSLRDIWPAESRELQANVFAR